MPLYGTLKSMPLPDLLQWLCNARLTGTLQVEKDRRSKSIHITEGRIVGCSSDDPSQRLGQFLLGRGKISEEQLREALQLQEISGQHLGTLLVELGAMTPDDLSGQLEAQAEDTIYGLFDWDDAVFRFQESEGDPPNPFPVSLRVEDVLLRGLKRYDEMREIREVFDDHGIVLEKTGKEPPAAVTDHAIGKPLWDLVNGERTVAEIVLQVHGSDYVVLKFLHELHRSSLVRIARRVEIAKPAAPEPLEAKVAVAAIAEPTTAAATTPEPEPYDEECFEDLLSEFDPDMDLPAREVADPGIEDAYAEPPVDAPTEKGIVTIEDSEAHSLEQSLGKARRLMSDGHFENALDILDRTYREHPGDESLRRLTAEAEAAFVEKAYRHYLPPSKVLVLAREAESLEAEELTPSEFFLLSRIDGTWDIKSIIQIAPLRESESLRTLKRMRENGLIDLHDP